MRFRVDPTTQELISLNQGGLVHSLGGFPPRTVVRSGLLSEAEPSRGVRSAVQGWDRPYLTLQGPLSGFPRPTMLR